MKQTQAEHSVVRGFTLVELLIVIAILAILAAATAVILNPGEILAQSRDTQRAADLSAVRSALGIYLAQVAPPILGDGTAGGHCTADPGAGNGPFATATCATVTSDQRIDGNGWVDVNLTLLPTNTPFARLPLDPVNNATYFYAYRSEATDRVFELNTRFESRKHRGSMASDGGNKNCPIEGDYTTNCFYEIGSAVGLSL